MATDVQIGNLALSHIAQGALVTSIDPVDGTLNSAHLSQYFGFARDVALEMHAWRFATTRKVLTAVTLPAAVTQWQYAFQLPNNLIRALELLLPGATDDLDPQPFTIEIDPDTLDGIILTNVQEPTLKFIARVLDTQKWSPLFAMAVSHLLASYIAGPITKKAGIVESQYKLFLTQLKIAAGSDAQGANVEPYKTFTPDFIASRRH